MMELLCVEMLAHDITLIDDGTVQSERMVADDGTAQCRGW
jgi:hypothetical protein